ncbi:hypothetical protein ACFQU2_03715 [Siccirubricoccus deserti]
MTECAVSRWRWSIAVTFSRGSAATASPARSASRRCAGHASSPCATWARSATEGIIPCPSATAASPPRSGLPQAESLNDEIDWAATQAAIALVAASGGGTVLSPAGTYLCNRTISFPECREYGERGVEVNWLGEGSPPSTAGRSISARSAAPCSVRSGARRMACTKGSGRISA